MPSNKGHYTVYLPAYKEETLINLLRELPQTSWHVFSKHSKRAFQQDNVNVFPVNNEEFIESMVSSEGVFCGAGFETPAEALFLGKKLMVIPMKNQYEQQCNAAALQHMGVPVAKSLAALTASKLKDWVQHAGPLRVEFPDITEQIIDEIIEKHVPKA